MSRSLFSRPGLMPGLMAATAMALALAACNKSATPDNQAAAADQPAMTNGALPDLPAAVPLQQGNATPIAPAPSAHALPAAAPIRVAQTAQPSESYAYLDRANGVMDAIGDAPPDYAYDDGDVSPWAWQTDNGDVQYAEPVDGGYRYYYYEPGADSPYLVRDPQYSYGYSGDQLVAVYDDRGALLPPGAYGDRRDYASRYYARAAYLNRLSREREHRGVVAANWAARRSEISAQRAQWSADRARQADWQAYHQAHERQEDDHWAAERQQRQAETQRFDRWQQQGFHTPPPPLPGRDQKAQQWQAHQQNLQQQKAQQWQAHQQNLQQQKAQQWQVHQQNLQKQQAAQRPDQQRPDQARDADRRAAQDRQHQAAQQQHDQQAAAQRQQQAAHDQRAQDQQRAAADRQQGAAQRQHDAAAAQQAHAQAAEQQRHDAAQAQQQRVQAQQQRAQAQQAHVQAAAQQQRPEAHQQAAASAHQEAVAAQRAQHEQAVAAHAQAAHAQPIERAAPRAEVPRPAAPHPQAPHGGERPHGHE